MRISMVAHVFGRTDSGLSGPPRRHLRVTGPGRGRGRESSSLLSSSRHRLLCSLEAQGGYSTSGDDEVEFYCKN